MEPKEITAKNFNFFITAFFILNVFVNLIKFENNLNIPNDYTHYSNQTKTELVVSRGTEYNLSFEKLNPSPKQAMDFAFAHIDFSSIHKFWLIHYQNFVLIQLKSFNCTFIPQKQFVSILQNMWHHSSFESGKLVIG